MLAQFGGTTPPTLGSLHLIRGYAEGFPRLFPFIGQVQCLEEYSQLRLEDLVQEFPDFSLASHGDRLLIQHRDSGRSVAEAVRIPLRKELVGLSEDFLADMPDTMVVVPTRRHIAVLTPQVETDPTRQPHAVSAYRIVQPGTLTCAGLSHTLAQDQIFNAPYSRFHLRWTEREKPVAEPPADTVRRELSRLLFDHLRQTYLRIVQHNVEKRSLTLENTRLRKEIERTCGLAGIIGQSLKMQELYEVLRTLAATDVGALTHPRRNRNRQGAHRPRNPL
jgi:hypothetical protein